MARLGMHVGPFSASTSTKGLGKGFGALLLSPLLFMWWIMKWSALACYYVLVWPFVKLYQAISNREPSAPIAAPPAPPAPAPQPAPTMPPPGYYYPDGPGSSPRWWDGAAWR